MNTKMYSRLYNKSVAKEKGGGSFGQIIMPQREILL